MSVLDRRVPSATRALLRLVLIAVVTRGPAIAAGRQGADTPAAAAASAEQLDDLFFEGEELYGINCMECHMDGGTGRTLAANASLAAKDRVIKAILAGSSNGDMPEFASTLTDRQIAAVGTFVRNYWDNTYGVVLETDVRAIRTSMDGRE